METACTYIHALHFEYRGSGSLYLIVKLHKAKGAMTYRIEFTKITDVLTCYHYFFIISIADTIIGVS